MPFNPIDGAVEADKQHVVVLQARRFLSDLYGHDFSHLLGCAFWCSPDAAGDAEWKAEPIERMLAGLPDRIEAHGGALPNLYFSVCSFSNERRSRDNFQAAHVIPVDDVGTRAVVEATDARMAPLEGRYKEAMLEWRRAGAKGKRPIKPRRDGPKIIGEDLIAKYGEPKQWHETSPGNWQWFYVLAPACEDRAKYEAVVKALGSDAKDAARYMRLPCGVNSKSHIVRQNGGKPFAVHAEKEPDYSPIRSIDDWMALTGAEVEREREYEAGGETKLEFTAANEAGLVEEQAGDTGAYWIECPGHTGSWPDAPEDMHTQDDGGRAKIWPGGGFRCFHGHCAGRTFNDFAHYIAEHEVAGPILRRLLFGEPLPPELDDEPLAPPTIMVEASELPRMVEQGVAALKADRRLFGRGDAVVRVVDQVRHEIYGVVRSARIVVLKDKAQAKRLLATWANWIKETKAGIVPCAVPADVAAVLVGGIDIDLPTLRGIIQSPFLKVDGTVSRCAPGFDAETGLWFDDRGVEYRPVLDAECTKAHAEAALAVLKKPLAEYVFATPLDHAVALAAMLTPTMRTSVLSVPLFAIDAPKLGSGKTKLATSAIALATGLAPSLVQGTEDWRELDKRVNGALIGGKPCILIDNIVGATWGTPDLCAVLTGEGTEIRPLGTSTLQAISGTVTIYATGNNIIFEGDIARRSLCCRIDAGVERPDKVAHSFDPVEHVREHRPELIHAALTIMRAYLLAGRPKQAGAVYGSFEQWCAIVRDALMWLGEPDVSLASCAELSIDELGLLLPLWAKAFGTGRDNSRRIKELVLARHGTNPHVRALGEMLHERVGEVSERVARPEEEARQYGLWLKKRRDQVGNGYRLRVGAEKGYTVCFVMRVDGKPEVATPFLGDDEDPI